MSTPPKSPTGDDDDNKPFSLSSAKEEEDTKHGLDDKEKRNVKLAIDTDKKNAKIAFDAEERKRKANLELAGTPGDIKPKPKPKQDEDEGTEDKDDKKNLSTKKTSSDDKAKDHKPGMSGKMSWRYIGMLITAAGGSAISLVKEKTADTLNKTLSPLKWVGKRLGLGTALEYLSEKLLGSGEKKDESKEKLDGKNTSEGRKSTAGKSENPDFPGKMKNTQQGFEDRSKNSLGDESFTPQANEAADAAGKKLPVQPQVEPTIDPSLPKKTDEPSTSPFKRPGK